MEYCRPTGLYGVVDYLVTHALGQLQYKTNLFSKKGKSHTFVICQRATQLQFQEANTPQPPLIQYHPHYQSSDSVTSAVLWVLIFTQCTSTPHKTGELFSQ